MTKHKFVAGEPEDGTMVLGVVYYVGREAEIHEWLPELEPIGYVVEEPNGEFRIGEPELED